MKLVYKEIDKDGKGLKDKRNCKRLMAYLRQHNKLVLIPDEGEDMWHTYNLVAEGDHLKASSIRKVQQESSTGSSTSTRIRTTISVQVESIDFDNSACVLRVKGRNVEENKFVKMGAYHTLVLEPNRKFTLSKEHWDSVSLERVENACDPTKHADLAAAVMQEGLAFLCLITSAMTIDRAKIDVHIPKKGRRDDAQRKKAICKFFDQLMAAITRHINFDVVKAIILASPGFVKDQFFEHMMKVAVQTDNKLMIDNKNKFVLVHSSSGFKHSLREILEDPVVSARVTDTKAASETKALQTFMTLLGNDPDRAFYGIQHVERANQTQAIETLLISDTLFRSSNVTERRRYVNLVDSVKSNGGEVKVFSSLHVSGEQLDQMTGIAAILRFPMPEIEEEFGTFDSDPE